MVEHNLAKVDTGVRFSSSAPVKKNIKKLKKGLQNIGKNDII